MHRCDSFVDSETLECQINYNNIESIYKERENSLTVAFVCVAFLLIVNRYQNTYN
jgi:hypothetical protein